MERKGQKDFIWKDKREISSIKENENKLCQNRSY